MHSCARGQVPACILRASMHWKVNYSLLMRKAHCESGLDPLAYFPGQHADNEAEKAFAINNDRSSGLFEFKPGTWRSTPYGGRSIWSAKWNSLGAGWMHHVGRGGEWACR